jgi:hypothetical protein
MPQTKNVITNFAFIVCSSNLSDLLFPDRNPIPDALACPNAAILISGSVESE